MKSKKLQGISGALKDKKSLTFHVLWDDPKKGDCSIPNLEGRKDVQIYKRKEFPYFDYKKKIILQLGAEPLSAKDKNADLVIIDMNWSRAIKFFKTIPEEGMVKRSIANFKTAYPKTNPTATRPQHGLMSVEAMFVAKLMITGKADKSLFKGYYFKDRFLKENKELIGKYKK